MFLVVHRAVALSNKPGIFPVGKMPNRVFLTVFSLDYYEFKWSKLRISSAKPDFVGLSHVSATAPYIPYSYGRNAKTDRFGVPIIHSMLTANAFAVIHQTL